MFTGKADSLEKFTVGMQVVHRKLFSRKRFHDRRRRDQVAGSRIRVNERHRFALDILNTVDISIFAARDQHGFISGILFILIFSDHPDRFSAGTFISQAEAQGPEISHIGFAGTHGFDNGIVIVGNKLGHFHSQSLAQICRHALSGIGVFVSRLVRQISDDKFFLLGLAAAAARQRQAAHDRQHQQGADLE